MLPINISVDRIKESWNPFEYHPWQGFKISEMDVQNALDQGRLVKDWGSSDHAGRIAFFVVNGSSDPIDIDVGVPDMGCHIEWIIVDGNHRLSAAIFSDQEFIASYISGSIDYAKEILGHEIGHRPYSMTET